MYKSVEIEGQKYIVEYERLFKDNYGGIVMIYNLFRKDCNNLKEQEINTLKYYIRRDIDNSEYRDFNVSIRLIGNELQISINTCSRYEECTHCAFKTDSLMYNTIKDI